MSGRLYTVRCDGREILSAEWLSEELKRFRGKPEQLNCFTIGKNISAFNLQFRPLLNCHVSDRNHQFDTSEYCSYVGLYCQILIIKGVIIHLHKDITIYL